MRAQPSPAIRLGSQAQGCQPQPALAGPSHQPHPHLDLASQAPAQPAQVSYRQATSLPARTPIPSIKLPHSQPWPRPRQPTPQPTQPPRHSPPPAIEPSSPLHPSHRPAHPAGSPTRPANRPSNLATSHPTQPSRLGQPRAGQAARASCQPGPAPQPKSEPCCLPCVPTPSPSPHAYAYAYAHAHALAQPGTSPQPGGPHP